MDWPIFRRERGFLGARRRRAGAPGRAPAESPPKRGGRAGQRVKKLRRWITSAQREGREDERPPPPSAGEDDAPHDGDDPYHDRR